MTLLRGAAGCCHGVTQRNVGADWDRISFSLATHPPMVSDEVVVSTRKRTPHQTTADGLTDAGESREERAARVARLRWAVQAGAYDPDPAIIAAFMLSGPRAIFGAGAELPRQ